MSRLGRVRLSRVRAVLIELSWQSSGNAVGSTVTRDCRRWRPGFEPCPGQAWSRNYPVDISGFHRAVVVTVTGLSLSPVAAAAGHRHSEASEADWKQQIKPSIASQFWKVLHISCIFFCVFMPYLSYYCIFLCIFIAYFWHISCIFLAYFMHISCIFNIFPAYFRAYFLHISCIFPACLCHICHLCCIFAAYFLHISFILYAYFMHIFMHVSCIFANNNMQKYA